MARLTRKNIKVFAGDATNNGVFGSLQANNPTLSNDVEQIQSLTAWSEGWNYATETSEALPPLEEFQGVQYVTTYQQAYIMQEGMPEWAATVTYYKGSLTKKVTATGFQIYNSLTDNNTGNLLSDTGNWKLVMDSDNLYALDNNVVHKTGDETISGTKTFTNSMTTDNIIPKGDITLGTSTNTWGKQLQFRDTTGKRIARIQPMAIDTTNNRVGMWVNNADNTVEKGIYVDSNGTTSAPTPTDTTSTSSHQIATVGWVNSSGNNVVHTSGNETIAGTKTFSSTISGSINGNAATVTNGVYTTGNQTIGGTKTFSAVAYGKASAAAGSVLTTVQVISNSKGQAIVLGNGLIVQWGKASDSGGTVQLPTPFSNTNYSVVFTRTLANGTNDNDAITSLATNSFSLTIYQGGGGHWIAVGK